MVLGLREANHQFGKITRAVRAGKTVVLTERGKPFAEIRPLGDDLDARRRRMAAEGRLIPARDPKPWDPGDWKPIKLKKGSKSLQETLDEVRGDRL